MRPIDIMGFGPTRAGSQQPDGSWLVTVTPPTFSGFKPSTIVLTDDQYNRYLAWQATGCLIQKALPELTASQREILISGISDAEFDTLKDED